MALNISGLSDLRSDGGRQIRLSTRLNGTERGFTAQHRLPLRGRYKRVTFGATKDRKAKWGKHPGSRRWDVVGDVAAGVKCQLSQ